MDEAEKMDKHQRRLSNYEPWKRSCDLKKSTSTSKHQSYQLKKPVIKRLQDTQCGSISGMKPVKNASKKKLKPWNPKSYDASTYRAIASLHFDAKKSSSDEKKSTDTSRPVASIRYKTKKNSESWNPKKYEASTSKMVASPHFDSKKRSHDEKKHEASTSKIVASPYYEPWKRSHDEKKSKKPVIKRLQDTQRRSAGVFKPFEEKKKSNPNRHPQHSPASKTTASLSFNEGMRSQGEKNASAKRLVSNHGR